MRARRRSPLPGPVRVPLEVREPTGVLAFSESLELIHSELQDDALVFTFQDSAGRRWRWPLPCDAVAEVEGPPTNEQLRERAHESFDQVLSGRPRLTPRVR